MHDDNEILLLASTLEDIHNQQPFAPSETSRFACAIYSALSNLDSLEIFCLAAGGIPAKTRILTEHKFSRKRYYVRLRRLIKVGLVQKIGKHYVLTSLGQMIYENQVIGMQSLPREKIDESHTYFPRSEVDPIREAL